MKITKRKDDDMTAEETKQELIRIRVTQQKYMLAAEKARQYDMMISAPRPTSFENAPDPKKNGTENKYLLALDYHEKVTVLEAEMIAARESAEKYIALLEKQSEREIITRRYVMCQTWEAIAETMNYSIRQVTRLHGKALKKMSLNVR